MKKSSEEPTIPNVDSQSGVATSIEEEQDQLLAENEAPILHDLAEVGFRLSSVYDLLSLRSYTAALPILLRHLKKHSEYDPRIREGLARALTVNEMQSNLDVLIEAFREEPDSSVNGPKWALGNAIDVLFSKKYTTAIAELALDRSHGEARARLVYALAKSNDPIARKALADLANDPEMSVHVTASMQQVSSRRNRVRRRRKASLEALDPKLEETSANFGVSGIPKFLDALASTMNRGFGDSQIKKVLTEISNMEPTEKRVFNFTVRPKWRSAPLQILIHKRDVDEVDIHFYSKKFIISMIEKDIDGHREE